MTRTHPVCDPAAVTSALVRAGLGEHAQRLAAVARPALALDVRPGIASLGRSRFGGPADLPAGTQWPTHAFGPYGFVGQLALTEDCASVGLPSSGLLSVFAADRHDQDVFWREPEFVVVRWTPVGTPLVPLIAPEQVRRPDAVLEITPRATWDLPQDEEQVADLGLDGAAWELVESLRSELVGDFSVGGYPWHDSLGYDPAPGPDWMVLLNLPSIKALQIQWADEGRLMVFVQPDAARDGDFSQVRSDAG